MKTNPLRAQAWRLPPSVATVAAVAAILCVLSVARAFAKAADQTFVGVLALASEPEVSKLLQLTPNQTAKLNEVIDAREAEAVELVAQIKEMPLPEVYEEYQMLLMEALRLKSTIKKNVNVLHHVMGYFKKNLSPAEKSELLEIVENYRQGYIPLIVPVTLLNHYVRKYDQAYLKDQYYLNPHPIELKLRNHV